MTLCELHTIILFHFRLYVHYTNFSSQYALISSHVRHAEQVHDAGGEVQPDPADLGAGQQEEGKDEGAGEQQLGVLALEAQARRHAFQCLEYQVAQQQGPARRCDRLGNLGDDGDVGLQVGEIQAHDVQQAVRDEPPDLHQQDVDPFQEAAKNQLQHGVTASGC